MATRLDKTIKRELDLGGRLYTVSVGPKGVKIVPKGGRKGQEFSWQSLLSGEVALERDLNLSLEVYEALRDDGEGTTTRPLAT